MSCQNSNKEQQSLEDSFNEGGQDSYSLLNSYSTGQSLDMPKEGLDKIITFLDKIPADWEKAKEHGRANRVNIRKINPDKKDNLVCQCCNMIVPENINHWPWEVRNRELGILGPGFPMIFEFIKLQGYLMLFLTLVYFIPTQIMIAVAANEKDDDDLDIPSKYSFGAFLRHVKESTDKDDINFSNRRTFIKAVSILFVIIVFLTLLLLIYLRLKLGEYAEMCDSLHVTPSDFCVQGTGFQKIKNEIPDGQPQHIEAFVKNYIEKTFDIRQSDIVYVNPAYKIGDIYKLSEDLDRLNKYELQVDLYCKEQKMDKNKYIEISKSDDVPFDFPKRPKEIQNACVNFLSEHFGFECFENNDFYLRPIDYEEVRQQKQKCNQELGKITADVSNLQNFTGTVFVTFRHASDAQKLLKKQQKCGCLWWLVRLFRVYFNCCWIEDKPIIWKRAPEPTDIFWENLGVGWWDRLEGIGKSIIQTFWFMLLCFGVLFIFETIKNNLEDDMEEKGIKKRLGADIKEKTKSLAWLGSWMTVVALFWINEMLSGKMNKLSLQEGHHTQTKMYISEALKMTTAKFINGSLILVALQPDPEEWFQSENLTYEAACYMTLLIFEAPIRQIINFDLFKSYFKIFYGRYINENKFTQREAHKLCEGHEVNPSEYMSDQMNLVLTCLFYSPILPSAIPCGLMGSLINLFLWKYALLNYGKRPQMLSSELVRSFGYVFPYIVFIWAISFKFFLAASEVLDSTGDDKKIITPQAKEFSNFSIIIFIIYWIIPLRVIFSCIFDEDKFNQIAESYDQVCSKFPVHYDVENPITQKQGQLRVLAEKERVARANNDQAQLQKLQEQRQDIEGMSQNNSIMNYCSASQARQNAYINQYVPQFGGYQSQNAMNYMALQQQQLLDQQRMMQMNMYGGFAPMNMMSSTTTTTTTVQQTFNNQVQPVVSMAPQGGPPTIR